MNGRGRTSSLREWLASEPFTLTLSSGFFGFFAHTGVLSVLEEEGVVPSRLSGASAGALVAAFWAAGFSSLRIAEELSKLDRRDFWDPAPGPGLLKGGLFAALLDRLLPVGSFEECRVRLRISVFDVRSLRTRVIDEGELAPAIRASCAVPGMFHPVRHGGRALYDGGILDRPGLAGVAEGERVFYHHLTSRIPFKSMHGALGRDTPRRRNLTSLEIPGLPRLDPFRLHEGPRAIEHAMHATRHALDQPVIDGRVAFP